MILNVILHFQYILTGRFGQIQSVQDGLSQTFHTAQKTNLFIGQTSFGGRFSSFLAGNGRNLCSLMGKRYIFFIEFNLIFQYIGDTPFVLKNGDTYDACGRLWFHEH